MPFSIPSLGLLFILTLVLFYLAIWASRRYQIYQQIYILSPLHHQNKAKTPSFGGLVMLVAWATAWVVFGFYSPQLLWLAAAALSFAGIGVIDDALSILRKTNKGLSVRQKLLLQIACAILLMGVFHAYIHPLALWEFALSILLWVGATNSTNLTDGLDGLLGGLAMISLVGFFILFHGNSEIQQAIVAILVVILGFFMFNRHRASIFMGDTGSLAIGAIMMGLVVLSGDNWALLGLGGVYLCEAFAVILQVIRYKWEKKRVFLMAPLHHHFELLGLSETRVVALFWAMGACFSGIYIWSRMQS